MKKILLLLILLWFSFLAACTTEAVTPLPPVPTSTDIAEPSTGVIEVFFSAPDDPNAGSYRGGPDDVSRVHEARLDPQPVENDREFVHQRDIQVALGILDHLGRLGYPDAAGRVRAGLDDTGIQRIDECRGLRR